VVDCTAEDCPAPMIEVTPVAEICLDANASTVDLEALITPNNGGIEQWSGPGIVDADAGIFNPDSAGPGTHQIIFTYTEDCDFNEELFIVVNEQPTANFTATDSICIQELALITYQGDSPNANFVWDFDNPVNFTGTGSGPYNIEWDTPGVKTISAVVTKNNCSSEEFTYNVYVEPGLDTVQIICDESTNDITFSWNAIAGVTEYEIFIDNVLVGTQSNTDYYVDGLNPGDNVKITVVALSEGLCPSTSNTLTCTAQNCPPVGINLVPTTNNICLDANTGNVTIDAQVNGGTGIDVVETWQGTGVDDQGVFDPVAAGAGIHEIIYIYAEGNCDESDTVNMVVYTTPTSDFSVTSAICISDTAQIDFLGSIVGVDTDFTFSLGAGGNISGTNPGPYKVWYNTPGTFDIKLTVEENGCVSQEVVQTIVVEPELVPSVINCNSSTTEIEFSWAPVDCASTYEVYIDGNLQGTQTTTTFTETGLQPNDAVNIQVVAISDCLCDDISFNKVCFALDCPSIDVELEPIGPFCLDEISDIVQIQVNQTGGTGTGTEVWTGPGVSQTGEFDGALAGTGAHLVTYTYTEDDCDFVTNMTVNVFGSPQALIDFEDGSCFGSNDGYIVVEGFGGTGTYEFDVNGQVNTTGEFYDLSPGDYTVIVSDGNDCTYEEVINIEEPADGSVSASGSTLIGEGETSSLSLNTTNIPDNLIDSIVWTENGNVVCSSPGTNCLNYDAMPETDALYCATIYYNGGCTTEDCIEVRIQVVKKVFIPNVFSPNNDGVNDRFIIYADQSVVGLTYLRVYSRWGELMYEAEDLTPNDESKGWDGTYKGKVVNPGVYVFKTEFVHDDGELEEVYGDITVVK
jgi:gliding motility-associated-like protein